MASISTVHQGCRPKPVNVLVSPRDTATLAELRTIGVRRISLGADPYTHALGAAQEAAAKLAKGDLTALASNLNFGHIIDLIKG
jgi:2-methylisocitrate lyase-like PEP mutase family enzyme